MFVKQKQTFMNTSTYTDQIVNGKLCTWLQSYGWCPTKKGGEVKAGDLLVYNFGTVYTVISKDKETKAFGFFTVANAAGKTFEIKISKTKNQAVK